MSVFKDKSTMPEKAASVAVAGVPVIAMPNPESQMVVRTAQTMREATSCERVYCRDAIDVQNLRRPRFGHGY